jgi:membrane protein required for colicin V production
MYAVLDPAWKLFGVLSPVDAAVVLVLILSAVLGFWSGFAWQVVRLVSLAACAWVALLYAPFVAYSLGAEFSEPVRLLLSHMLVFAAALAVCYLLAYLFRDPINALKPEMTDRVLGGAFGLVKGALLVAFCAFLLLEYAAPQSPVRAHLEQATGAASMGRFLGYALPDSVRERLKVPRALSRWSGASQQNPQKPPESPK